MIRYILTRFKHIKWHKGNGEMLGYAIVAPLFVFVIVAVMYISTYMVAKEQLTVATYAVGRAAVVSSSEQLANARALAVLKTVYGNDRSGTQASGENGQVWYSITLEDGAQKWRIGYIADIKLSQTLDLGFPIGKRTISSSIAMMIEDQTEFGN